VTTNRRRLDDNLYVTGSTVRCAHCDTVIGTDDDWLHAALVTELPPQRGGLLIQADPRMFVDAPVVYRQAVCPGCHTALLTEVVSATDRNYRTKRLA
jgi:N-methylhydantoinase B